MKYNFIILTILFLNIIPTSFGQPTSERKLDFGSSLEKYKNRDQKKKDDNPQSSKQSDEEIIQANTDLFITNILVSDSKGNIIKGLQKEDFILKEDGISQSIEMFSVGENATASRSIVLIIDNYVPQLPYFEQSIQAAKKIVDKLNPNDKMAIVSSNLNLLTDFTSDKTLLEQKLESLEGLYFIEADEPVKGWEFSNLLAVLNEFFTPKDTNRIIILQGSGNEIGRINTTDESLYNWYKSQQRMFGYNENWKSDISFDDIEEAIKKSEVTVYSVVSGIRVLDLPKKEQIKRARKSLDDLRDARTYKTKDFSMFEQFKSRFQDIELKRLEISQKAMSKVAGLSGGYTSFLEKPEDAETIYENIFNDFSNRYLIGYYPTNQEKNGKHRSIKVEVRSHPEYIITGRKTYLPAKK